MALIAEFIATVLCLPAVRVVLRVRRVRFCLSLLLAFACSAVPSPSALAQAPDLRFTHLTVREGLPSNRVYDVLQDRMGFMWFATRGGLVRFDGLALKVYTYDPDDPNTLASNAVRALEEDAEGNIWVGTENGLHRIDPVSGTVTRYQHDPDDPTSLPHNIVRALLLDSRGTLWVGTNETYLSRFDPELGTFVSFQHRPPGVESLVFPIEDITESVTAPGTIWLAGWHGIGRFDTHTETFTGWYQRERDNPLSLPTNACNAVAEDGHGRVWVGMTRGRFGHLDPATGHFTPYERDMAGLSKSGTLVYDLFVEAEEPGVVWVGAASGLYRIDTESGRTVWYQEGEEELIVVQIAADNTGTLWLATDSGVSRAPRAPSPFRFVERLPGKPSADAFSVSALLGGQDGALWVGQTDGSIARFGSPGRDRAEAYPITTGFDGDFDKDIRDMLRTRDGSIWASVWNRGLYRLAPSGQGFAPVIAPGRVESWIQPWALLEDREGYIWIGFVHGGLLRYDPRTEAVKAYRHDPSDPHSLASDRVLALFEDRSGHLWVGGRGLSRLDRATGHVTRYAHASNDVRSLSSNGVLTIAGDAHGTLWVGTADGGLNRFDPDTEAFTRFTEQNSDLPSNTIATLEVDKRGHLWAGTGGGIVRYEPEDESFTTFRIEDGTGGRGYVTSVAMPSGELLFGGPQGMVSFFPDAVSATPPAPPPPVALTGVAVDGAPLTPEPGSLLDVAAPYARALRLPPRWRDVTFSFAALHYVGPVRYRYRLEGFDADWQTPSAIPEAVYTNLDPGNYTFRVEAATDDGAWSDGGRTLALTVTPFFWETWWFTVLCGLGTVVCLHFGYRMRVRRAEQRQKQLTRLVEARTRALRDEKQKTEEQAAQLRALDEAKSRFFANVSHEFRTPLTLTIGPLEDLRDGMYGPVRDEARQPIGLAIRSARRVLDLINQILDVAKLDARRVRLQARRLDIGAFAAQIADAFTPLAERVGIALTVQRPKSPVWLWADPEGLDKVLSNLLSNAFKFTPQGGAISVALDVTPQAEGDGDGEVGAVLLTVADSGPGIGPEHLPHLFDRFYQADGSDAYGRAGTGIGLALAKELAELHGGSITVESTPGEGAAFTVRLPLGRDHFTPDQLAPEVDGTGGDRAGDVTATDAPPPEWDLHTDIAVAPIVEPDDGEDRTTLLVVDDHAGIRAYVRRHFEADYRILEAADGAAGLALARERLPDLVISDVMMPVLDGVALCRALKEDSATEFIPVVLLTAKAGEEATLDGLGAHADDYVTKPFNVRELAARVHNLIHQRQKLRDHFGGGGGDGVSEEASASMVRPARRVGEDDAFVRAVREAIDANLGDEAFGVEALAETVGVSRSSLYRRLGEALNQTPPALLRGARLARAARLLEAQAGNVSEVAYAVGFKSVSHFSRTFRATYGVPPSAYAETQASQS